MKCEKNAMRELPEGEGSRAVLPDAEMRGLEGMVPGGVVRNPSGWARFATAMS